MVKDYTHLRSGTAGLSDNQLDQHVRLYAGLVGKLNEIEQKLSHAGRGAASAVYNDYAELKRREAFALNGAYLHELYFDSLGASPPEDDGPLGKAMKKAFGSRGAWERDFRAAATSTTGWTLLTRSNIDGLLHNYILEGYHIGIPVHQSIILAVDCWEHAYAIDFGMAKQDYLSVFFKHIDWAKVQTQFDKLPETLTDQTEKPPGGPSAAGASVATPP